MKSDIYSFTKETYDINCITELVKKISAYNNLSEKQELRLTLLAEELAEMIPHLLKYGKAEFSAENKNDNYELRIKLYADEVLDSFDREKLLSVSKSGRNAAATGILNKIRIAAETMLSDYVLADSLVNTPIDGNNNFYNMGMDITLSNYHVWTLDKYRDSAKENSAAWDELEKSIIANLADDITVGVINGTVEIIVKKSVNGI